jgi:hypothetical protein
MTIKRIPGQKCLSASMDMRNQADSSSILFWNVTGDGRDADTGSITTGRVRNGNLSINESLLKYIHPVKFSASRILCTW